MYNNHHIHFIIFLNLTGFNDKYHYSLKGYIADEFGPEITQTQKEDAKDGDGEDGPRPKQPRSSADRIGTSEVEGTGLRAEICEDHCKATHP